MKNIFHKRCGDLHKFYFRLIFQIMLTLIYLKIRL
jgi:hypothetical protein